MELPDVAKVERLSLQPGDKLVLSVPESLDESAFRVLCGQARDLARACGLPEGSVLILDGGVSLQVLEASAVRG